MQINPIWADYCPPPEWLKVQRRSRRQKAGLTYEAKVAKLLRDLGQVEHGQWIRYVTSTNPRGRLRWAQPDILLQIGPDLLYLVECKLTYRASAETKLRNLYVPLLRLIHPQKSLILIQSCKHLSYNAPEPIHLDDLASKRDGYHLLHLPA